MGFEPWVENHWSDNFFGLTYGRISRPDPALLTSCQPPSLSNLQILGLLEGQGLIPLQASTLATTLGRNMIPWYMTADG
jgi:hypothetical protein